MMTFDSIPKTYFMMFHVLLAESGGEIISANKHELYVRVCYRFKESVKGFAFQREYERQVKALEHESWLTKLMRKVGLK